MFCRVSHKIALVVLSLSASVSFGASAIDRVKKAGKLVIAVDASYPPMEFEGAKGQIEGFDVDLANEIAKKVGVKTEFVVMNWDGILAGLASKRYDIIMSSMNITAERQKQVDFVEYVKMSQVFVAPKGKPVQSDKDLAGKVVGVQADTTSSEFLENAKKRGIAIKEIKAFKTAIDCFAALKAKHIDLIVIDEPVGRYFTKQDAASFEVSGRALAPEPIGIAIRKEDQDLKSNLEKAVDELRKDGSIKTISVKWFGGELGQ